MAMNLSKLQETVKDRGAWWAAACGAAENQTQLSHWSTTGAEFLRRTPLWPTAAHKCTVGIQQKFAENTKEGMSNMNLRSQNVSMGLKSYYFLS